jgi:adenylate cyclase
VPAPPAERKLAAILSADVVGYSRLMAEDEDATVRTLVAYRKEIHGLVADHRGRVVDATGDNLLAEFPTALDAVECAVEIQRVLGARNAGLPEDHRMEFRIGVHLGDVAVEGERLYGDGVNIAARLEGLAQPAGICISDDVLHQVQRKLEFDFDDLGEQSVKNIPDPVHAYRLRERAAEAPEQPGRRPLARWVVLVSGVVVVLGVLAWRLLEPGAARSPSPRADVEATEGDEAFTVPGFGGAPAIAVLAFDNLSGDPDQEYFADGIAEDLITRLSSVGRFPVISRNSSFTYKGQAVDMKQVGRELGARYVVEGSVRKAGSRVRVSAQLIDTAADHHIWAETYDRELSDIFAVQDEIAESILRTIRPELHHTELERAARRKHTEFGAYDLLMRSWWHLYRATPQDNAKARSLCEEAIELDPSSAMAWALIAVSHWGDLVLQWTDSPAESLEELKRAARKTVALDASTAGGHRVLAYFYQATGQTEEQIAALEQAVSLDPSWSGAHDELGFALALTMGRTEEALEHLNQSLRLDPKSPVRWINFNNLSLAHWSAGRYEVALDYARQAVRLKPDADWLHRTLALSYVELGRLDEARAAIDEALRIRPDLNEAVVRDQWRTMNVRPDLAERGLAALRDAGLPE